MATIDQDARYYRGRLGEERERALKADTPEASAAHRALAEMYRRKIEDIDRLQPAHHG